MTTCGGLRLLVQIFHRIYRGIVDNHFIVQMRTRRLAGHPHGTNNLPAFYFLAYDDKDLAEMPVFSCHPKSVIHHDRVTVTGIEPRLQHDAISARLNSGAVWGGNIHSRMEAAFTTERIQALAKTRRDSPPNRPDRGHSFMPQIRAREEPQRGGLTGRNEGRIPNQIECVKRSSVAGLEGGICLRRERQRCLWKMWATGFTETVRQSNLRGQ